MVAMGNVTTGNNLKVAQILYFGQVVRVECKGEKNNNNPEVASEDLYEKRKEESPPAY
jgi:hypothetical protein